MPIIPILILTFLTLLILGILFTTSFVSASPGEIKVISGPRGQRVLHGQTGYKIPILERVDTMTAGMISVDARTISYVPTNDYINVKVDAAVKVKIGTDKPELFKAATRNFLYKSPEEIANEVRDTLEGHLRGIIGQMKLEAIVQDRTTFSNKVQENAKADLEEMGLEIVAFNIQGLVDENNVIENLGIDHVEDIKKNAAISKAKAIQAVAQQQAESDKLANDARVAAELEIAEKQTELAKRQAALKAEADTETAKADAAYEIQKQIQRKDIEREKAEADIIKQQKEAEIKTEAVKVMKQELAATINAKADADKYAAEKLAEAELIKRQKAADAELYERKQEAEALKSQAEATKFVAEQEAKAIEAKGKAEADAIAAKLQAEAEGLEKKAEAMAKMQDASIIEMVFNNLPAIVEAAASPLANVDSITMYGEGNSAKLVGDTMKTVDQITQGIGVDIPSLITSVLGGKMIGKTIANEVGLSDNQTIVIDSNQTTSE